MKFTPKSLLSPLARSLLPPATPLTATGQCLVHFHIQKTGGTSVNHAFYSLAFSNRLVHVARVLRIEERFGSLSTMDRGRLCHIVSNRTTGFVRSKTGGYCITRDPRLIAHNKASYLHSHSLPTSLLGNRGVFSFAILRDPVDRLLSRYRMDLALWREDGLKHYGKDFSQDEMMSPLAYFRALQMRLPHEFFGILSTFSPRLNLNEGLANLERVNFVMRQACLQEDYRTLLTSTGAPLELLPESLGHAKSRHSAQFDPAQLGENVIDYLREALQMEYSLVRDYL